ncbi:MAG TPA: hypothetical protein VKY22_00720 [Bradyrhizobium sp.]|nr:hypothetical protein [Bradyrhizobium sp.]
MSVLSEETPTNPQDPLHYAPRRSAARPELRLSSVSSAIGETPFDRPSKPDPVRRAPPPPTSLSSELENAVFESLRRQMDPEVIPEPPGLEGRLWRRAWLGVGAAVAVAAIAAALFVTLAPREEAGASLAAAAAPSPAPDDATKPTLEQFRALMAAGDGDQSANHEQSDRLLKQFMLWRQKADAGDKAR